MTFSNSRQKERPLCVNHSSIQRIHRYTTHTHFISLSHPHFLFLTHTHTPQQGQRQWCTVLVREFMSVKTACLPVDTVGAVLKITPIKDVEEVIKHWTETYQRAAEQLITALKAKAGAQTHAACESFAINYSPHVVYQEVRSYLEREDCKM